jgi:hypothetical protein
VPGWSLPPHDPRRSPPLTTRQELADHFRRSGAALGRLESHLAAIRVRDGQIIESRDYVDHGEIARVLAAASRASAPAGSDAAPQR